MSVSHLTEQQIQSYVDGELIHDVAEIEEHLRSCKQCRDQLNAYALVRSGMVQEPPDASFSDDFEDVLMSRILRSGTMGFRIKDYLVAAFTGVMIIALLCYPFIYNDIRILMADSYLEGCNLLKETAIEIFCYGGVNGNCLVTPVAALIMILAFKILDKTYIQRRLECKKIPVRLDIKNIR